jgi:hypothetical protein
MYEVGQRVVIRGENGRDEVALVEEILIGNENQLLCVRDPATGVKRVVNPVTETIVEHLED